MLDTKFVLYACTGLLGTHLIVLILEWCYREWCYPMHGWMDTLFLSVITRHSSLCRALDRTVHTLDSAMENSLLYVMCMLGSFLVNRVRVVRVANENKEVEQ
jgi:hypothetical protein